ncbi:MAG: hypothetical protein JSV09_01895 [Thermoplasmata archaeon]|nr:MAG: hypothetical protein JSV09_01895 [Thermoplasmata archaeon]
MKAKEKPKKQIIPRKGKNTPANIMIAPIIIKVIPGSDKSVIFLLHGQYGDFFQTLI